MIQIDQTKDRRGVQAWFLALCSVFALAVSVNQVALVSERAATESFTAYADSFVYQCINPNDGETAPLFARVIAKTTDETVTYVTAVAAGQTLATTAISGGDGTLQINTSELPNGSVSIDYYFWDSADDLVATVSGTLLVDNPEINAEVQSLGGQAVVIVEVVAATGTEGIQLLATLPSPPTYSDYYQSTLPINPETAVYSRTEVLPSSYSGEIVTFVFPLPSTSQPFSITALTYDVALGWSSSAAISVEF